MIKVSIIVPCYKVEKYLPRCLDSLMCQTLEDIEVICINDGSPDKCLDIIKSYKSKYPNKIVIIDKQNEGVWRGRRDAIALAQGEYIGFVDSDDCVATTMCEDLYFCAKSADADISVCGFYRVDADTNKVLNEEMTDARRNFSAKIEPKQLLQLNGAPWNKLFKAGLLKSMYNFGTAPKIFDDLMMHLLVYPFVDGVVFVPKPLVYYGIRNDSIMTTISSDKIESTYDCMKEVKQFYLDCGVSDSLIEFLDLSAGLHLGVSLMFRIANDPSADLYKVISDNRKFLDDVFPAWRSSSIPRDSKSMRKIALSRAVYKSGCLKQALSLYKFMITHGLDIKW